ncbi:MAG: sensor histidine kinase [Burkholderiales bacterium]|nr:MAG: sensor histidine kinase [Burkholderiales bacterium]
MSLKLRLNLLLSALLGAVLLASAFFAMQRAREDVRAEIQSTMDLSQHILCAGGTGAGPALDPEALARVRHFRMELYDAAGRPVYTSRDRPDPDRGGAPEWFAAALTRMAPAWEAVRCPWRAGGQAMGELVIRPDPSSEIQEVWEESVGLAQLAALIFLGVNLAVYGIVGRALRPVDRILEALTGLEQGRLETRLPQFPLPELARIARAFNRMAEALEQSMTRNRQLSRRLLEVQEDERKRLARELHDELGQYLSAIHAEAAAILSQAEQVPASARASAQAIVEACRAMMGIVRGMLARLRPGALDELGLEEALRELVAGWRRRHSTVACTLEFSGDVEDLDEGAKVCLYRLVQEGLTNVAKHADARRVEVRLARTGGSGPEDRVSVEVQDDGRGLAPDAFQAGHGLLGMRERVESLGGRFTVESLPEGGVRVAAELPAGGRA